VDGCGCCPVGDNTYGALLGIKPRSDGRALVVSARSLAEALARGKQQLEFS
jgi:hypothetical protein